MLAICRILRVSTVYWKQVYRYQKLGPGCTDRHVYLCIPSSNIASSSTCRKEADHLHVGATPTLSDLTFYQRVRKRLGLSVISRDRLRMVGTTLYTNCVDNIDHQEFIKYLNLPDTYYSWYIVTELHVWMTLVRVMHEEKHGRTCRNDIIHAMWQDVDKRLKQLAPMSSSVRKEDMTEMSTHSTAAFFSYDEGLLSDDRVLAGALWRRFFKNYNNDDVKKLETLVEYVRKTVYHLDSVDSYLLLRTGKMSWLPLIEKK